MEAAGSRQDQNASAATGVPTGVQACPELPARTEAGRVARGRGVFRGPRVALVATACVPRASGPGATRGAALPASTRPEGPLREEGSAWAGRRPIASASGSELHAAGLGEQAGAHTSSAATATGLPERGARRLPCVRLSHVHPVTKEGVSGLP